MNLQKMSLVLKLFGGLKFLLGSTVFWALMSVGSNVPGLKCLWSQKVWGQMYLELNCSWAQMSVGLKCVGLKCLLGLIFGALMYRAHRRSGSNAKRQNIAAYI